MGRLGKSRRQGRQQDSESKEFLHGDSCYWIKLNVLGAKLLLFRKLHNYFLFLSRELAKHHQYTKRSQVVDGGHNDGGTIHTDIPEEWCELSYDKFLENVVTLSAAAHYGFTPDELKEKQGLKEFFGFE